MGLLLLAALFSAPAEARVETLAGQSVAGQLTALNLESVTLATADGPRTFAVKELAGVSLSPDAPGLRRAGCLDHLD